MERVTIHVEHSEDVRLEVRGSLCFAVGPAFEGCGESPSEALEDYRLKLQAETSRFMDHVRTFHRRGAVEVLRMCP